VADRRVYLRLLSSGQELRQLAPLIVEDAERRVAGAAQLASGLQHPFQEDVEVQLGRQGATDVEQLTQTVGAAWRPIITCGAQGNAAEDKAHDNAFRRGPVGAEA
jgi:hypothetical protein